MPNLLNKHKIKKFNNSKNDYINIIQNDIFLRYIFFGHDTRLYNANVFCHIKAWLATHNDKSHGSCAQSVATGTV